jgi:hypothetical protein
LALFEQLPPNSAFSICRGVYAHGIENVSCREN